jgi:arylsulfatase A-like enzyme
MLSRWIGASVLACCAACGGGPKRPNVVWIVWDTVRADHMSVYGYERRTTPFVEEFARGARVYEDALSSSSWTVPSHASMFTGLLPAEHGAMHGNEYLDEQLTTVAELLRGAGYGTFAWAANPHVSAVENFLQGFEVQRHPWDDDQVARARAILDAKLADLPADAEMNQRKLRGGEQRWVLKAAGDLARENWRTWLDARDSGEPFFAFFNYMEAHRPLIPPRRFRERVLSPEQVDASYRTLFEFIDTWKYCFGLRDYSDEELALLRGLYDAALLELDELFAGMMAELDARGLAENTLVILTADHGEHLGDLHLLDHQYSLSHTLLRVPLIVRLPGKIEPGRDARPVMSMDLFPTVLALCGVEAPRQGIQAARNLLDAKERRPRLADYSAPFAGPLTQVGKLFPDHDVARFERGLLSIVDGQWKLVRQIGGASALYDLDGTDGESRDVGDAHPGVRAKLQQALRDLMLTARPLGGTERGEPRSAEHQAMLDALGYGGGEQADDLQEPKTPDGGR